MGMTENGVSTTTTPGQEQFEYFSVPMRPGRPAQKRCQYDYRHADGELFSCVAMNLEDARNRKDLWLKRKDT